MEGKLKKEKFRFSLRECFRAVVFSQVPYDIWKVIVFDADLRTIGIISQTCHKFRDLVLNLFVALRFKKEGQISIALTFLERCAENGNSSAMFYLGHSYCFGDFGVKTNDEKTIEWFRKAAESGSDAGMAFFAFCLKNSFGVEKDENMSNYWAKKALSRKNAFTTGYCNFHGFGTPKNLQNAFYYMEISANEGDQMGQYWLGYFFENGIGVERNQEKANFWYSKAAEQGLAVAQYYLGCIYRKGIGCDKNEDLANKLIKSAAKLGHEIAKNEIDNNN